MLAIAHVLVAVLAVSGSLAIDEQRCPAGTRPGDAACTVARTRVTYASAPRPPTKQVAGAIAFAKGVRVTVTGRGRCEAESATTVLSGPDGSVQILGPAARVEPFVSSTLTLLVDPHPHAVRLAWLDPLEPSFTCGYLGDPMSKLAVPTTAGLVPRRLVTGWIAARTLAKRKLALAVDGSKTWGGTTENGARIYGNASWHLRLGLGRATPPEPKFVG